jgi:hypothetical protein
MKIKELKKDLLYSDIEERINSIKRKKNIYLLLYRATKIIVFIAGATVTVLTGWKILNEDEKFDPGNYVLVISASITVLAAIEGLFSFKDKGKSNDLLLFELRRLRDRMCYDFTKGKWIYEKNKDYHFLKYQEILEAQKTIIEDSSGGED